MIAMKFLLDDPIGDVADDDLGRGSFARSVAELIAATTVDTSVRFGVFGEWGEGKTSAMRLIEAELRTKHKHIVAWYSPWDAASVDDAWHALLTSVAAAVKADMTGYVAARSLAAFVGMGPSAADASDYTKALKAFSPTLAKWSAGMRKKGRIWGLKEIRESLGARRLTVFVDDLDRVDPKLVPRVLMRFRETFDQPGFSFVLGLSPSLIRQALRGAGYVGGDASERFLEKIIEYPNFLPPVSNAARLELLSRAEKFDPTVFRAASFASIAKVLPRNPRRLKLLLRYLRGLKSLLSRFSEDEIDWGQLYVALMLRLEFSAETHALLADEKTIEELASRSYTKKIAAQLGNHGAKKSEERELRYAPTGPGRRRFLRLCSALGGQQWASGRYDLHAVLALPDAPPVLTRKELTDFFNRAVGRDRVGSVALVRDMALDSANPKSGPIPARCQALFDGIVDLRDGQLDLAIDSQRPDDAVDNYRGASMSTVLLQAMIEDLAWFDDAHLTLSEWNRLRQHCVKWSRYNADPAMKPFRQQEIELLRSSTARLPANVVLDAFALFTANDERRHERSPEFLTMYDSLEESITSIVVRHFVDAFREVDGIGAYGRQEWNWRGRHLLFDPDSAFHEPAVRAALQGLAKDAIDSAAVSANFMAYFVLLWSGAFEAGNNLSREGCATLLADEELVGIVWGGMTARPLSLRVIGSLLEERKQIRLRGTPSSAMPIPPSWQEYAVAFPNAGDLLNELQA
jgi:hypothetical protein